MSRAALARQQQEAAAFAALVLIGDQDAITQFFAQMDDHAVKVMSVRLAGWLDAELSARFQRERFLTRDEADTEAVAYMQRIAGMLNVRAEEAQA